MKLGDVRSGIIITGPKWPEPVEIKKIENFDSYLRIIGTTIKSSQYMDQVLHVEEISDFQISNLEVNFGTEPWKGSWP